MKIEIDPLHEPFDDPARQRRSAVMGMWIFLATEVLFFGGPLLLYAAYRFDYGAPFVSGSSKLDIVLGTVNTAILLLSSFLMVFAVESGRAGRGRHGSLFLAGTALLGLVFLGIKGFEWHDAIREGLWPGTAFTGSNPARLFFTLYFTLTGLHAIHLTVGVAMVFLFATASRWNVPFRPDANHLTVLGLYWHFIDIVWVFLFPLLYLAHRHA